MVWRNFRAPALLCCALICSCSSVKEELKPVPLEPIEAKLRLNPVWSTDVNDGQDARYQRLQPALKDDKIFSVDVDGKAVAVDAKTGKRLWTTKLKRNIGGGFGIAGDLGLVGTLDGYVVALQLSDGAIKWQAKASSEVVSAPEGSDSVAVAVSIDGRVQAYDLADGKEIWNYDHSTPILSLRSTADPLVADNYAYVSFDNGQLLCFDLSKGQLKWSVRIGQPEGKTELERLVDADGNPQAYGPYIYGASYNGRLIAAAKGTGRVAWAQDLSTFNHFAISDNIVVVVDSNSHVMGVDATTGSLLWTNDKLHRRGLSAPAIFGSAAFAVDQEGFVHGLKLDTGEIIARSRISNDRVLAQPIVKDNTMFVYNTDGVLSAYTLEQGDFKVSIWSIPTDRYKGAIATKKTGVE